MDIIELYAVRLCNRRARVTEQAAVRLHLQAADGYVWQIAGDVRMHVIVGVTSEKRIVGVEMMIDAAVRR